MSSDRQDILLAALQGLCAEYGAIRVCSLDMDGDGPALVLASPPFGIPGDVPMAPYSLLIPWLYDALRAEFGSLKEAARIFGGKTSLHFEDCGLGVE